jgi:hypothetical protein
VPPCPSPPSSPCLPPIRRTSTRGVTPDILRRGRVRLKPSATAVRPLLFCAPRGSSRRDRAAAHRSGPRHSPAPCCFAAILAGPVALGRRVHAGRGGTRRLALSRARARADRLRALAQTTSTSAASACRHRRRRSVAPCASGVARTRSRRAVRARAARVPDPTHADDEVDPLVGACVADAQDRREQVLLEQAYVEARDRVGARHELGPNPQAVSAIRDQHPERLRRRGLHGRRAWLDPEARADSCEQRVRRKPAQSATTRL